MPLVLEIEEWKTMTVLFFCLKTYGNHCFREIEEWKTMTALLFCLKTYENHRFWEVEEWKTMTVLFFCLKTYENHRFWEVEEHHAGVLDTSGPTKLCWQMVLWLQDRSRASKPVLVQVLGHQGHQTLCWCIENPKPHFWRSKKYELDPRGHSK